MCGKSARCWRSSSPHSRPTQAMDHQTKADADASVRVSQKQRISVGKQGATPAHRQRQIYPPPPAVDPNAGLTTRQFEFRSARQRFWTDTPQPTP
jgi:hypothetical protein